MPNMSSQPSGDVTRPASLSAGQTILGRYRVIQVNDEGGFGTVNICWDKRLQRRVAIKQIPLKTDDVPVMASSTREEALTEARTACLLGHPNIIQVFDFESDKNDSYIVMEYVDGLNLAELLSRVEGGTLTFDEVAHVLSSVSSALAFAHENGVLHLDIKPANIMIDRTGTVKLADFGMATLASAAGYGGARGGTIGYMPPEQIEGESVDERSDVFSLAVVIYEALTGVSPFLADSARESLRKIDHGPRPALSDVEPGLAGMVEDTLLSALSPDPANRMASVDDFSHDIVTFLGDPAEGRLSLKDLVSQAESDEEGDADEQPPRRPPLLERMPWLPALFARMATGACCAVLTFQAMRVLLPGSALIAAVVTGGAAVGWPPLGSAFAIIVLALALGLQQTAAAFPLALLVAFVGLAWWVYVGSRDQLASLALLLPATLSSPFAGTFVAGYTLTGVSSFATGSLSWGLSILFRSAADCGFDAGALVRQLIMLAHRPQTWAALMAAGTAALVCSKPSRSDSPKVRAGGQLLCLLVLGLLFLAEQHMEKGSILEARPLVGLAIAIMSCVVMCVVTVLVGPHKRDRKGEEDQ